VRATVLSISNLGDSTGQWAGGPALGAVGNRWGVRTALAIGALGLGSALLLFGRAVRHHGRERQLAEAEPAAA
jgi:DHA3 family tetracycline resistance protein-like MFS transporter